MGGSVMEWKENCFLALDKAKMFEDSAHRTRFKELVDCFSPYPFFTKGLCKCIYLSAWDDTHFCVMLETLTDLTLGKEKDTQEMSVKGEAYAEEETGREAYFYQFSGALLNGTPIPPADHTALSPEVRYIVHRTLTAAEIIDNL
jgi:hypothetical protein